MRRFRHHRDLSTKHKIYNLITGSAERKEATHSLGQSNCSGQATLVAGNEVAIDGVMMDDSAAELGSLRVGVLEDDTRWVIRAGSLGARVDGVAVREEWELVPRASEALIFVVSLYERIIIFVQGNLR
jgi:hypothetical protein